MQNIPLSVVLELEGQCQGHFVQVRRWWWWEEEDEDVSLEGKPKKIEVQGSSKIVSVAADLSAADHLIQRTCPSFLAVRRAGPNSTADRAPGPAEEKCSRQSTVARPGSLFKPQEKVSPKKTAAPPPPPAMVRDSHF